MTAAYNILYLFVNLLIIVTALSHKVPRFKLSMSEHNYGMQ